jgi:acetyltransferase-like isoleucine patch superfamily enzyme
MKIILTKILFRVELFCADEYKKSKVYSRFLKVKFGKNVRITGKPCFGSEPYLVTIGNEVTITEGVIFHTHDGGVSVFRTKYPGINIFKPIHVGNNVFIGSNTTILPGITIGDNVVIGATSVITKNVPDNVVVAGVPAKIIRSLNDYETRILKEAVFIAENDPETRREKIKELINRKMSTSSDE